MSEVENVEATPETPMSPDELLDSLKGKFENCIVTGFNKEGHLFMSSSVSNIPFMHWTLNRSIFELGLFEKQAAQPETQEAPASDVDTKASES
jgi:hypothetical protein|tara:strand:+ start:6947 stop:7225 length:279 start_codon:yes stop_codon:yes gene_type:complete